MRSVGCFLLLVSLCSQCRDACADLPVPQLKTLTPPGGKVGTTTEIALGGANLEGATALLFGRPGLSASHAEGAKFKITVANDALPGPVDVRVVGTWGVSNPRTFWIGNLDEAAEKEPNDLFEQASEVPLDRAINGVVGSRADVDFFKFKVAKGQRVVIDCIAERIDSRLDGVLTLYHPTGRQLYLSQRYLQKDPLIDFVAETDGTYTVRLHDLIYNGSGEYFYRLAVHTKPQIAFAFPPLAQIGKKQEITLLGRNLPDGKPDQTASVEGRTLEAVRASITPPADPQSSTALPAEVFQLPNQAELDGFAYRAAVPAGVSQPVLIGLTEYPVVVQQEPNDTEVAAQTFDVPAELVGRFDRPGDHDWYRFSAKKGDVLVIEGISERAGFPNDLTVFLRRVLPPKEGQTQGTINAKDVGEYDDNSTNVGRFKFDTSTHDPLTRFTVPGDGDYLIDVRDRFGESRGDARHIYRVRIAPEKPDFRLAVVPADESNPSSLVVRQGGSSYAHVFAMRRGRFAGEITVQVENLPEGVSAQPIVLGPNVNEAPVVFEAAETAPVAAGPITVKGTAAINDAKVTRTARSGTIIWPQTGNVPRPSRLAQSFCLAVREKAPYQLAVTPTKATLGQGSQLTLALTLTRRWADFTGELKDITALLPPKNVDNAKVTIEAKKNEGLLHLYFKNNVAPGTYSFALAGTGQIPFTKTPENKKAKKSNVPVADPSPPITVTVLPRPADLSANPKTPSVKAGEKVAVKVSIKRRNDYKGPIELTLVVPPGVTGVMAEPVTVPADKNDGSITIAVAKDVPPADKASLVIRGAAMVGDQTVTVDAQLTLKVAK